MAVNILFAWLKAKARLRQILDEKFNEELVSGFTVADVGGVPLASGVPGLFAGDTLFLPGSDQVLLQPSPSPEELKGVQQVAIYIGPSRASETGADRSVTGAGYERGALLPFAASVVFNEAPFAQAPRWEDGTQMSREEVMTYRGGCYIGALQHTIAKYGCHHEAILDTIPISDLILSGGLTIVGHEGEDNELLAASVWHEFLVDQDQLWPTHTNL